MFRTESKQRLEHSSAEPGTTGYRDSVGQGQVFSSEEGRGTRELWSLFFSLSGLGWRETSFPLIPPPCPCMGNGRTAVRYSEGLTSCIRSEDVGPNVAPTLPPEMRLEGTGRVKG